jgi:hypothetical protein
MADLSGKADPFSEGIEDMVVLMLFLLQLDTNQISSQQPHALISGICFGPSQM